ncbi:MAG TPA: DNRLRE domain-containing protein, partial [Candidatus Eisenbacteria bacterium]
MNGSKSETLVLDKDSTGQLWVTWMEARNVKVNRTVGNDLTWGQPFDLPVQGGLASSDDISSVVAFGNKVGIMWSNQTDKKTYFAVHVDGTADALWEAREEALADAGLALADDHLNLKVSCDADGALYAVTKTSLTSSADPLIYVLKRSPTGSWSRHLAGIVGDKHTRPILLFDKDVNMVYVLAESNKTGRQSIYVKAASAANLVFPSGVGTPFIDSSVDVAINNPTSTKQCVSGATGLLVLASDQDTHFYLHNYMDLGGVAPAITAFNPTFGLAGQEITITGARFIGATGVGFNGTSAASFVVDSKNQIRAIVPAGASTGRITVSTAAGTGTSGTDFVVVVAPTIAAFTPTSGPVGTEVTVQGSHFTGVTAVAFNGTAASSFTVDSDTVLRAAVASGTTTGTIRVTNGAGSAESGPVFTVTAAPSQVVLNPAHDTRVDSSIPTTNFGSSNYLRVKGFSVTSATHHSYLKFNVTGLTGTVQSAKIRLYVTDESNDGGSIFTVSNNYPGTTTPWLESGVTWNNAPTIGGTPLDQKGAVALNTWVEFTVTPAISGNGIYSFGMTSGSANSAQYSSKEGANIPELVLLVSGSVEPPSITSFAPPSGPVGTEVTVQGSGFTGVTAVSFNGTAASSFAVDSDISLRATVAVGTSSGQITVTSPGGTGTSASSFTVLLPPSIASFAPTSGTV